MIFTEKCTQNNSKTAVEALKTRHKSDGVMYIAAQRTDEKPSQYTVCDDIR